MSWDSRFAAHPPAASSPATARDTAAAAADRCRCLCMFVAPICRLPTGRNHGTVLGHIPQGAVVDSARLRCSPKPSRALTPMTLMRAIVSCAAGALSGEAGASEGARVPVLAKTWCSSLARSGPRCGVAAWRTRLRVRRAVDASAATGPGEGDSRGTRAHAGRAGREGRRLRRGQPAARASPPADHRRLKGTSCRRTLGWPPPRML